MKCGYYVGATGGRGLGVFAAQGFVPGALILRFQGPLLRREEVLEFSRSLQVADEFWLGPSGEADDFINHSCEPNCGISGIGNVPYLIAVTHINRGEELLFDYSTVMKNEPWWLVCRCDRAACRGRVGNFPTLPRFLQQFYLSLNIVPDFIRRDYIEQGKIDVMY